MFNSFSVWIENALRILLCVFYLFFLYSIFGVIEMEVFWSSFPSTFGREADLSNSSLNACSSGGNSRAFYTVRDLSVY